MDSSEPKFFLFTLQVITHGIAEDDFKETEIEIENEYSCYKKNERSQIVEPMLRKHVVYQGEYCTRSKVNENPFTHQLFLQEVFLFILYHKTELELDLIKNPILLANVAGKLHAHEEHEGGFRRIGKSANDGVIVLWFGEECEYRQLFIRELDR